MDSEGVYHKIISLLVFSSNSMYFFVFHHFQHGADANKKNHDGKTPLDLVKDGFPDVADLLRGDVALLEAAKKGTLAKVCFFF